MGEFKKRCPRCGSKAIGRKAIRIEGNSSKVVYCKECDLKLINKSVDYLYWRWNRTKEEQAAFIIPLVNRDPDNLAYCGKDLVEIWGDKQKLCDYVSAESGRKVVCVPSFINPEGVLFKGV